MKGHALFAGLLRYCYIVDIKVYQPIMQNIADQLGYVVEGICTHLSCTEY